MLQKHVALGVSIMSKASAITRVSRYHSRYFYWCKTTILWTTSRLHPFRWEAKKILTALIQELKRATRTSETVPRHSTSKTICTYRLARSQAWRQGLRNLYVVSNDRIKCWMRVPHVSIIVAHRWIMYEVVIMGWQAKTPKDKTAILSRWSNKMG